MQAVQALASGSVCAANSSYVKATAIVEFSGP